MSESVHDAVMFTASRMELGEALFKRTSLSITAEGGEMVSIYIDTVKALNF